MYVTRRLFESNFNWPMFASEIDLPVLFASGHLDSRDNDRYHAFRKAENIEAAEETRHYAFVRKARLAGKFSPRRDRRYLKL